MNSRNIIMKNLVVNLHRFAAYFLSSCFCVMVFFLYTTLYLNNDIYKAKNFISIRTITQISLSVFLTFSIFFISYAYGNFIKSRSKEFGIMLMQGTTLRELQKLVFKENLIITFVSLIVGLLAGTLFSKIFFLTIIKISNAEGISFKIHRGNYAVTIILFTAVSLIIVLYTMFKLGRVQILDIAKLDREGYEEKKSHAVIASVGFLAVFSALVFEYLKTNTEYISFNEHKDFIFILLIMSGIYMFIYGLSSLASLVLRNLRNDNILKMPAVFQMYENVYRNKKIIFLLTILGIIIIYYSSYGYTFNNQEELIKSRFNADIIYLQDYNIDNDNFRMIESVASFGGKINNNKMHEYFEVAIEKVNKNGEKIAIDGKTALVSDQKLEKLLGVKLKLEKGKSVVFTNVAKAKLVRIKRNERIILMDDARSYTLSVLPRHFSLFLTANKYAPDYVVVIPEVDYSELTTKLSLNSKRSITTMDLENWESTNKIVNSIKNKKLVDPERIISKYEIYNMGDSETKLSKFMFLFTEVILFIVSGFMLYFNIILDMDRMNKLYVKLFRIGVTNDEAKSIIMSPLKIIFFLPWALSALIGGIYVIILTFNQADRWIYITNLTKTLILYFMTCIFFYYFTKERVSKKILK